MREQVANFVSYVEERDGAFWLAGTRVSLDSVVYAFWNGQTAESIAQSFPTVSLEQVYGAITFYLGHQDEVDASIRDAEEASAEFEVAHPIPQGIQDRLREARERISARREE